MEKRSSGSSLLVFMILLLREDLIGSRRTLKENYRETEKAVLDSILGKGYDKRIRPSGQNVTDGPALIRVNIYLRNIHRIDDVKMEYSVQVTFREQWNDERLRYVDSTKGKLNYLTLTDPSKVWMPDTFFRNEKEAKKHEIIVPNVYVRIYPNGDILYSIRISLTLACPMDLRLYPLDKQVCVLQIASYGWATDDLVYKWKDVDPVQIVPGLHLPRFTLEQYKSAYCNVITNTGEYSCLKVELIFKREFSYYLITIYVPCCMLVIVSWVSFWLDQHAIPARVSLGVTTLLTMSTQTSGISAQLPPVSYTKAIDVWTGACQGFVFCALLEFALVNYASRSDIQRERSRERMERARRQWELENADSMEQSSNSLPRQTKVPSYEATVLHMNGTSTTKATPRPRVQCVRRQPSYPNNYPYMPNTQHSNNGAGATQPMLDRTCELHTFSSKNVFNLGCCRSKSILAKFSSRAKRIDVISRFIFPLLFAIFNLAYWMYYLLAKGSNESYKD